MSKSSFSHALSPPELIELNEQISKLIDHSDTLDDAALLALVEQREAWLKVYVDGLEHEQKQAFIQAELETTNQIKDQVQKLLTDTFNELSKLIKGKKAIKKYT